MNVDIQDDRFWHQDMHRLPPADEDAMSVHEVSLGSKSVWREIAETIALTLLIFLAFRGVIQNFEVEGPSMEPTFYTSQYLLVNKLAYAQWDANFIPRLLSGNDHLAVDNQYIMGGPQRGDIIVFLPPDDSRDFIKRVIALPGETVEVRANDGVYINGNKLDEPYLSEPPAYTYAPITIPDGQIFALGDNRNNSRDGHSFGPVRIDSVVGVAWFSYWPQATIGFLPHPTYGQAP